MADAELLTAHLQHAFPWAKIEEKKHWKTLSASILSNKQRPENERMSPKKEPV